MLQHEHDALIHDTGFGDLPRSQVLITGRDRVRLLQGLTTNDIKRLQPGDGCETFLTNVQGKVIGHGFVFCAADSFVLNAPAGQASDMIRSLDRYVVREDVRFADQSDAWHELLVAGEKSGNVLVEMFGNELPVNVLQHREFPFRSTSISIRRTGYGGPNSFQLSMPSDAVAELKQALTELGAQSCTADAIEILRIEAGTPIFGRDITNENLPQEVNRNSAAISFTKGCYLGQETVARIDALGHVNRTLCGLRFDSATVPAASADIVKDGKTVAKITSSCYSPRLRAPLALAYVRRGVDQIGNKLSSEWGTAEVVQLPLTSNGH